MPHFIKKQSSRVGVLGLLIRMIAYPSQYADRANSQSCSSVSANVANDKSIVIGICSITAISVASQYCFLCFGFGRSMSYVANEWCDKSHATL